MAEVYVDRLDEFRRGLRRIDSGMGRELGKVNKDVGFEIVKLSKRKVALLDGRYPSYSSKVLKIKPSANQRQVIVTITPGAAEAGARRHPVFGRWQNQAQFSRRVWPKEIAKGQGYVVRPTVEEQGEQIGAIYVDQISDFARKVIGA
jgi:hypothetical protein